MFVHEDIEGFLTELREDVSKLKRRSQPTSAVDLLGTGYAALAIQVADLNNVTTNGNFYAEPGALHTPDPMVRWTGSVIAKDNGSGMQQFWNTDDLNNVRYYMRTYVSAGPSGYEFSDWRNFATPSGYVEFENIDPAWTASLQTQLDDLEAGLDLIVPPNKVYRQNTEPTNPDSLGRDLQIGDQWLDTDNGNVAYIWDGTEWVNYADYVLGDVLAELAAAQATAEAAADAAANAADFAEALTKVYRQTSAPTNPDSGGRTLVVNDVWFDSDDDDFPRYWDGDSWESIDLPTTSAAQAMADAAEAAAIAAAEVYTDGQFPITADDVAFAIGGGNLAPDSSFESTTSTLGGWIINGGGPTGVKDTARSWRGATALKVTTGAVENWGYYPMDGAVSGGSTHPLRTIGETYTASLYVNTDTAQTMSLYDYGTSNTQGPAVAVPANTWTRLRVTFVAGTNVFLSPRIAGRTSALAGNVWIDGFQIEIGDLATAYAPKPDEILPSTITVTEIADNAVTTPKLIANAVVASKIATDAITTDKLEANAITSKHSITGALVQTEATASRGIKITSAGLNAYDSGGTPTLVINATTGAITMLGALTSGSTVTGATVTGGTVQSESTAARGVKMTSAGLVGYDGSGVVKFSLAAATGVLTLAGGVLTAGDISGSTVTGGTVQSEATVARGIKMNSAALVGYNSSGVATFSLDAATGVLTLVGGLVNGGFVSGAIVQTETTVARGVKMTSSGFVAYNSSGVATMTIDAATGSIVMLGSLTSGSTIDGAVVTGGTIQTEATASRGIKMNSSGLVAYDGSGVTQLVIDASTGAVTLNGTITGGGTITGPTFQTASSGQRIVVRNDSGAGIIEFYGGLSGETPGSIDPAVSGGKPSVTFYSGTTASYPTAAILQLVSDDDTVGNRTRVRLFGGTNRAEVESTEGFSISRTNVIGSGIGAIRRDNFSGSSNASGIITVTHGGSVAPDQIFLQSASGNHVLYRVALNATTFTVLLRDLANTTLASTATNFHWMAVWPGST